MVFQFPPPGLGRLAVQAEPRESALQVRFLEIHFLMQLLAIPARSRKAHPEERTLTWCFRLEGRAPTRRLGF